MKNFLRLLSLFLCMLLLAGCSSGSSEAPPSKTQSIPFTDGQLYAVAFLGYEDLSGLDFYIETCLDDPTVPIHHFSGGEYYLIIPRYPGMTLHLYRNYLEHSPVLIYEEEDCSPFIVRCNVSDIFPDVTVSLTYEDQTASFTPYISLKDGSTVVGDLGLDISQLN